MPENTVHCSVCGTLIDEPSDTPPAKRKPCPNCGSKVRTIGVTLSERLNLIDDAYAQVTRAGNDRIEQLISAQAAALVTRTGSFSADAVIAPPHTEPHTGVASGTGSANDATATTETLISAELRSQQDGLTQAAIRALIDVVRVGQEQGAKAAEESLKATAELNALTKVLVKWTQFIGIATIVAVIVGVGAIVVAVSK